MPDKPTMAIRRDLAPALRRVFSNEHLRQLQDDAANEMDIVTHSEPWGILVDALFHGAYPLPADVDPLEPALDEHTRLRNALTAAEHERDEAQTAADVFWKKINDFNVRLHQANRERDELLRALDETNAAKHRYMAMYDKLCDAATDAISRLEARVTAAYDFADELETTNPYAAHPTEHARRLRKKLNTATPNRSRMALTEQAKRYLEENESSSTEAASVPRVAREGSERNSNRVLSPFVNSNERIPLKEMSIGIAPIVSELRDV